MTERRLAPEEVTCGVCHAKPDEPCVDLDPGHVHEGRANYAALVSMFPEHAPAYVRERLER
jgi:hypothetical protein